MKRELIRQLFGALILALLTGCVAVSTREYLGPNAAGGRKVNKYAGGPSDTLIVSQDGVEVTVYPIESGGHGIVFGPILPVIPTVMVAPLGRLGESTRTSEELEAARDVASQLGILIRTKSKTVKLDLNEIIVIDQLGNREHRPIKARRSYMYTTRMDKLSKEEFSKQIIRPTDFIYYGLNYDMNYHDLEELRIRLGGFEVGESQLTFPAINLRKQKGTLWQYIP